jgi:hypothetical protein
MTVFISAAFSCLLFLVGLCALFIFGRLSVHRVRRNMEGDAEGNLLEGTLKASGLLCLTVASGALMYFSVYSWNQSVAKSYDDLKDTSDKLKDSNDKLKVDYQTLSEQRDTAKSDLKKQRFGRSNCKAKYSRPTPWFGVRRTGDEPLRRRCETRFSCGSSCYLVLNESTRIKKLLKR